MYSVQCTLYTAQLIVNCILGLAIVHNCFSGMMISTLTGPALFRFTAEPKSATLSPGGSITLSCVATGRDDIKYSWYRRKDQFNVFSLSLIDSKTEMLVSEQQYANTYTVSYTDVSNWKLYQCSAHSGGDVIFSNTSRITREQSSGM